MQCSTPHNVLIERPPTSQALDFLIGSSSNLLHSPVKYPIQWQKMKHYTIGMSWENDSTTQRRVGRPIENHDCNIKPSRYELCSIKTFHRKLLEVKSIC